MRKLLSLAISMLLVLAVMAACSKAGNEQPDNQAQPQTNQGSQQDKEQVSDPPPPEKVTISIYYPTPDQPENRALEDDKIRRFTEQYPHVEIVKSDWHYKVDEIGIKMAANEAPTVFNTWATEGRFLVERGWAADITEFFNEWEYKDQMNPVLQNQFIIDGKIHGIAQNGYVVGTVVNKKMLDEAGVDIPPYDWTWDELYQTAVSVANPEQGISGIAPMGIGNEAGWNWTNFLFLAGGDIQEVSGNSVQAAFASEAGVAALEFYHKLRWEGNAIPQDWALGWGDAVGSFAQGRTAMVIAGASDPVDQALNQGAFTPEDILVYPIPAYQKGGNHTGVLGGNFLVVNPKATKAQQEMAFKYITFDYFSEEGLVSIEKNIQERKDSGSYFVPPVADYFQMDSEYGQKIKAIYDKYDNVYQFAPEVLNLLEGKPEAQFNTQEYYGAMTNAIQEVFSKRDVDIPALLKSTEEHVQKNFFDPIVIE